MKKLLSIGLVAASLSVSNVALAQDAAEPTGIQISGPALRVKDIEQSLTFYVDGLGLNAQRRGQMMVILTGPDISPTPFIMLRQDPPSSEENARSLDVGNGLSRIFLLSHDVEGLHARLVAAGYAPTDISASSGVFFVTDPDGWRYEITGSARSANSAAGSRPAR